MDDKDLPEWYQMLKGVFTELNAYDMRMYEDMSCANILAQVRFVAIRDKERSDIEEQSERAAELLRAPVQSEQTCPVCKVGKLEKVLQCDYCFVVQDDGQV